MSISTCLAADGLSVLMLVAGPAGAAILTVDQQSMGNVEQVGVGGNGLATSAPVTFTNFPAFRPIEFDLESPLV